MEIIGNNAVKILVAVLGGILLLLIRAYINKRRLFVVVPKSFSHTGLADTGSAYMLSLYNRGIKTEERVLLQLKKDREYSLLATTDANVEIQNDQITIDRINPNEELNVVLLVEGGDFSHESIIKISSNACKGSVIDSPEKVPLSFGNTIGSWLGLLFVLVGFPLSAGFFGYQYGQDNPDTPVLVEQSEVMPARFAELEWEGMKNFLDSSYYKEDKTRVFPIKIIETKDLKNAALVVFQVKNEGNKRLEFSASLSSAADNPDGGAVKFGDHFKHSVQVFPSEFREVSLKINKPDNIKNKTVFLDIRFEYKHDHTHNLEKEFWIE